MAPRWPKPAKPRIRSGRFRNEREPTWGRSRFSRSENEAVALRKAEVILGPLLGALEGPRSSSSPVPPDQLSVSLQSLRLRGHADQRLASVPVAPGRPEGELAYLFLRGSQSQRPSITALSVFGDRYRVLSACPTTTRLPWISRTSTWLPLVMNSPSVTTSTYWFPNRALPAGRRAETAVPQLPIWTAD